ncbi:MAG: GYD domain-containing protein [Halobacteriaceae archaeon]
MPTYISLVNYSEDGFETLVDLDSDEFLEESKATAREHGGELKDYYLTMGEYDAVVVTEFPDADAASQTLLSILGTGIGETQTMRAFTEDETRDVLGKLGE